MTMAGWKRTGRRLQAELAHAQARLTPVSVQFARIAMLTHHDRVAGLPAITAPTLVLGASDDALIPLVHSERLARLIPEHDSTRCAAASSFPAPIRGLLRRS